MVPSEIRQLYVPTNLDAFHTKFDMLSVVVTLAYLPFLIANIAAGHPRIATIQGLGWLGLVALTVHYHKEKVPRRAYQAGHFILTAALCTAFFGAMVTGQGRAVLAWALPLAPLYAAYLLGPVSALLWAGVSLVLLFLLHYTGDALPIPPEFIASGWRVWGVQSVTTLVILLFGQALRRGMDEQVARMAKNSIQLKEARNDLAASLARLQALEESRQQFIEMLVHDMRTPLTGIYAYSDRLSRRLQDLEPEDKDSLARVLRLSSNLADKVTNVLEVSRLEDPELQLWRESFDYCQLAREIVAEFQFEDKAQVSLEVESCGRIYCDQALVRRVLENLLANAQRYCPKDSVVRVIIREVDGYIETRVIDDGPGICPTEQAHIFERFRRATPSTGHASGLGLALCKLVIEKHRGEIGLNNLPGKGCEFWFTLPAA